MRDEPIIQSRLDTDFYKLTMGQFVWKNYRDIPVTYAFKNRTTKVRLAEHLDIGELREELDHARALQFTEEELRYIERLRIEGTQLFSSEYVEFLRTSKIPNYVLEVKDGQLVLEFSGPWSTAIWWELIALPVVNELYFRSLGGKSRAYQIGRERLCEKLNILKNHPELVFLEFGTRRRYSREWQRYVVQEFTQLLSKDQFLGTSNVKLAMDFGIEPKGTMAHELVMVKAGIQSETDEGIRSAQNDIFKEWWDLYGPALSIALVDTFGSDFSFDTLPEWIAREWKGFRQDSGDPVMFFMKLTAFYRKFGINLKEKLVVFSDGLDIGKMKKHHDVCRGRIKDISGPGTNFSNDCGEDALSIVIKPILASGRGLVKLSDNLAKATGEPENLERYKRVCGYAGTFSEECRY